MTQDDLSQFIDYTLLDQAAAASDIERLCHVALRQRFHAVCVNPVWVTPAADLLAGSTVKICSVAGFPLGANRTGIKLAEALLSAREGAGEIDMVANIGRLVSGDISKVEQEIREVRRALPDEVILKVIIEAARLTEEQIAAACRAVIPGGAEFVKSGTGYFGGVTVEQVHAMVRAVSGQIKVKAAGGIRSRAFALELIAAGAMRIGASRCLTDVQGDG
jgi:deoxyribose-phosphate aldolase